MTMIEDRRKKENIDGEEESTEEATKDDAALRLGGKNPLAAEETIQEDDAGGD